MKDILIATLDKWVSKILFRWNAFQAQLKVDPIATIESPIQINLRSKFQNEICFSDHTLESLKQKKGVFIFIHGFSVALGEFGQQSFSGNLSSKMPLFRTKYFALNPFKNFFAQAALKEFQQKDPNVCFLMPDDDSDDALNGTEAHAWSLHIENNINCARHPNLTIDLEDYTRVIPVFWDGDPANAYDYMAAVEMAVGTGLRLVPFLRQLIAAGIQVNILAHSLGNLVLLQALQKLAEEQLSIHAAWFWQAAVPNDVFDPDNILSFWKPYYYLPRALDAVKYPVVMYSKNDEILGPLHESLREDIAIALDPTAGWLYLMMSQAILMIDHWKLPQGLESAYHFANLLVYPLSTLFRDDSEREKFYRDWIKCFPESVKKENFPEQFSEQIEYFSKAHTFVFNVFTVIFAAARYGFYVSIRDIQTLVEYANCQAANQLDLPGVHPVCRLGAQEVLLHHALGNEMATLLLTILYSANFKLPPALGWSGAALGMSSKPEWNEKLRQVDLTEYATSHSILKMPPKHLLLKGYQQAVLKMTPDLLF